MCVHGQVCVYVRECAYACCLCLRCACILVHVRDICMRVFTHIIMCMRMHVSVCVFECAFCCMRVFT